MIRRLTRLLRLWPPFWAWMLAFAVACGGSGDGALREGDVAPAPTATAPPATRYASPGQQRTVAPLDRLPTRTPAGFVAGAGLPGATVTVRERPFRAGGTPAAPGVTPSGLRPATPTVAPPAVHDPEHTPGPPAYVVPDEVWAAGWAVSALSCFEDFFSRVEGYDGVEVFGPEVLNRLSAEMLAVRGDCVAEGWSPVFVLGPVDVCRRLSTVGGEGIRRGITPLGSHLTELVGRYRQLGPTGMGGLEVPTRRFLIHLEKLPYSDGSGCWYGGPIHEFLYFSGETSEGEYRHSISAWSFPRCEAALRGVLRHMRDSGVGLDFEAVLNARQLVVEEYGELCGLQWVIMPSAGPAAGCRWPGATGYLEDGGFLVNWLARDSRGNPLTDARGGSPCWLLRQDGVWEYSDPVEVPGIDYATGRAP